MKNLIFLLLVTFSANAQTPTWTFEKSHCKISFSVSHFGISETDGQFKKFDGTITTTKPDFVDAKITMNIDVNSIDTDDDSRDGHLKSADFFDTEKYPTMTFVSTSFKPVPKTKNKYRLTGNLTMHGVTKQVTLNATYGGTILKDPFGNTKAGFKFTGKLNRKDFGLTWNKNLDAGGVAVGDEVTLNCNIEFLKSK
jgi:polyisoprenoid-binding protein YceI